MVPGHPAARLSKPLTSILYYSSIVSGNNIADNLAEAVDDGSVTDF